MSAEYRTEGVSLAEDRLNVTTSISEPAHGQDGQDGQDGPDGRPVWRDVSAPPGRRVADLLARMTLAEKIGQLGSVWLESEAPGGKSFSTIFSNGSCGDWLDDRAGSGRAADSSTFTRL